VIRPVGRSLPTGSGHTQEGGLDGTGAWSVASHGDLHRFTRLVRPVLAADPVGHGVVLRALAAGAPTGTRPAVLLSVHRGERLAGAALRHSGGDLLLHAVPSAAAGPAARRLARIDRRLPALSGPRPVAEAFALAWCELTDAVCATVMSTRLFELRELIPPAGMRGDARVAGRADVPLLARWRHAFALEALGGWRRAEPLPVAVARQVAGGQANVLWELGGRPVSLAVASQPSGGVSIIGPVWTPVSARGRGFASAVVAAAARWALRAGAEHVILYTDLANPVSNSVYPKLGFRPVRDCVDIAVGYRSEPGG
jgi:predicted GNAT family acetyltransferase